METKTIKLEEYNEKYKIKIIITKADKGKRIIMLPLEVHNNKIHSFLSQTQFMKLNINPRDQNHKVKKKTFVQKTKYYTKIT
jgi:hypothetical protein